MTGRLERYLFKRPETTRVQTVVADESFFGGTRESQRATLTVALTPVVQRKGIYELIPEIKKDIMALIPDYPSAQVQISAAGGFSGSSTLTIKHLLF